MTTTSDPRPVVVTPAVAARTATDPAVARLLADLDKLPGQQPALMRVAQLAGDPDASNRLLADACAVDPALTARLLRVASSAYYGRPDPVTSVGAAIATIGRTTLRSTALAMALGLAGEHGPLPGGFWDRAAMTAVASSLTASACGAAPAEAMCAGLLADVGQALLFRAAPSAYQRLLEGHEGDALPEAERAWCGLDHPRLGALGLAAAGLSPELCEAVGRHHETLGSDAGPLARAVRAGVVLARGVDVGDLSDAAYVELPALTGGALQAEQGASLALQAAAEAAALSAALA